MTSVINIKLIRKIKKSHENITIFMGTGIGFVLTVYFFTFAHFVDKNYSLLVNFQIISSILLVLALVFIKRAAFVAVKWIYGRRSEYKLFLETIAASDLEKGEQLLLEQYEIKRLNADNWLFGNGKV